MNAHAPMPPTDPRDEFDWQENRHLIVSHRTETLAVYPNRHGDVVIRQQQDWPHEDGDTWIILPRERAQAFAAAIIAAASVGPDQPDDSDPESSAEEPPTAESPAEESHLTPAARRSKRYRERKRPRDGRRHANRDGRDGRRDAEDVELPFGVAS